MKPIFTIHAGEYLVASHIEEKFKDLKIWLPTSDTGIDLLVTNPNLISKNSVRATSIQVKFSKDYLGNQGGGKNMSLSINSKIKSGGWWTFKHDKIENSQADLWVLVLYRFSHRDHDFVIIEPSKLLERYNKLGKTSGTIQSYVWVTENGKCWETHGLVKEKQEAVANGIFKDPVRDLTQFLNNWQPLKKKSWVVNIKSSCNNFGKFAVVLFLGKVSCTTKASQQSVHLTLGMASANALALGDARWRLARPICGNLKQFSTPCHFSGWTA